MQGLVVINDKPLIDDSGYNSLYTGAVKKISENNEELEEMVDYAFKSFKHFIPFNTLMRTCYFGKLIREHADMGNPRVKLVVDILHFNSYKYQAFYKNRVGQIIGI